MLARSDWLIAKRSFEDGVPKLELGYEETKLGTRKRKKLEHWGRESENRSGKTVLACF